MIVCTPVRPSNLRFLPPQNFKLRIEDPPRRKHMVFMGASVYANLMHDKEDFWMTRADYAEYGAERLLLEKAGSRTY